MSEAGRIAIIGRAGRFPGARSVGAFWDNLVRGVESIRPLSDEDLRRAGVDRRTWERPNYVRAAATLEGMEDFDAAFFGFSPRDGAILDPQHRHFLECAWEALEDAGHDPAAFPGAIGVFAGSGHNAYLGRNLLSNPALLESVGFFLLRHTGNDKDFLPTRVSYLFDLRGPSVAIQTACSTSLVAVHLACQSLLGGECDLALAGGVTIELPHGQGYFYEEGEILSPDGHCRAFDAGARGTVFGSGVGVVVLRRLEDALRDGDFVHAVVLGSAVNNDGAQKVGYLAPSVDGQAAAVAEAVALAGVPPESISYIEAHGTGTPVGDPIELAALAQALGKPGGGPRGIGSVKSNIGHLDTAAGVASLIKTVEALKHRQLPPSLHFERPNPAADPSAFAVVGALRPWEGPRPLRAGVNSLGVGGTNAHVVLEEPPAPPAPAPARRRQLLLLSAKTPEALEQATDRLADHLLAQPQAGVALADVAYTLQVGRRAFPERRVLLCTDHADAAAALKARDPRRLLGRRAPEERRKVAFLFPGGGAQHPDMARALYDEEPAFREAADRCFALLRPRVDHDLKALLFPPPERREEAARVLERPSVALPALLTVEHALCALFESWGLRPAAMLGHSMGEYAAACLAGVFTLDEALQLVALRGQLFERLPPGAMLSVPLPSAELAPLCGPLLQIAAVNAPALCVASGPIAAIEDLERRLAGRGVEARRVHIQVAAHSAMLEPILPEFRRFLRTLPLRPPRLPFLSNVTGAWIESAQAIDPEYWVRHLREPVRFSDGLARLAEASGPALVEVGPGSTLCTLARAQLGPAYPAFPSLRQPKEEADDHATCLTLLGRLWLSGVEIDWRAMHGEGRRRVPLPTYPFARTRHWIEPGAAAQPASAGLRKLPELERWFHVPAWRPAPLCQGAPPPGRWLLLADEGDSLCARVAAGLRQRGAEVTIAVVGRAFAYLGEGRYALRPSVPEDLEALLSDLGRRERAPDRILHLLCAGPPPAGGPLRAYDAGEERAFFSLLALGQALGKGSAGVDSIDVLVVTTGAQQVAGEALPCPERAMAAGPCKVMMHELPGVRCRVVDVEPAAPGSWQEAQLAEQLPLELAAPPTPEDCIVAYRGALRLVQDFAPVPLPAAAPRLRERGVYLITGGLGGLGLVVAEHLARQQRARLILLGRTALPERERWPGWIAAHGEDDETSRRLRRILALEEAGAEVLALAADVARPEQVQEALQKATARFGAIQGVFHAAGVLDDGALLLKTPAAAAAVLAPKARGVLALEAALGGAPLDFFVLFSSVSAITGLAGQVDYAAANAFLDAFALGRSARDGSFTVSVNWNTWQQVGMAAALGARLGVAQRAVPAGRETGHPLLGRCTQEGPAERRYEVHLGDSHWTLAEHRVKGGPAVLPGTAYLEIARAAIADATREQTPTAIELREVLFQAPFAVLPGVERALRVTLRRDGDGFDLLIEGAAGPAGSGDGADWEVHARGRGRPLTAVPGPRLPPGLASRCGSSVLTSPGVADAHMAFGPRWDSRLEIRYGAGEALVRLALPDAFVQDLDGLPLHPALLDMATGGAQGLIAGADAAGDFYVPLSYGRLLVRSPLPARIISHVRYRAAGPRPEVAAFDVTIYAEDGTALVEVEDFVMRRTDRAALAVRPPPRAATGNKILELGLNEGILPAEGVAALLRVLGGPRLPQVVVSSQDLGALRAATRPAAKAAAKAGAPGVGRQPRPPLLTPHVAPRSDLERTIAATWEEVLGIDGVGIHDDFFELGGHSLLLTQVVSRLRRLTGADVSLRSLFDHPTVAGLAGELGQASTGGGIQRLSRDAYRVKRSAVAPRRGEE